MKRLLLILLLTPFVLGAQNSYVDSIATILSSLPDSVIAQQLNDSSRYYRMEDFQLSYDFAQKAMFYAGRCGNKRMEGNSNNYCGISKQLQGHYSDAMQFYTNAERLFSSIGWKKGLASTYINIGVLSQDMSNHQASIDYYRRAYSIAMELGDSVNASSVLNNIATTHSDLKHWDSALYYNMKSLAIRRALGDADAVSTSLSNIGLILDNTGRYEEAYRYQLEALGIDSVGNDRKNLCVTLSNLGSTLIHLRRYDESKHILQRAIDLSREIDFPELELDATANMMSAYDNLGEYKAEAELSRNYVALKDSIADRSSREAYAEMQAKFNNEVQQHDIENLQKINELGDEKMKRQQIAIYLGAFGLILLLVFAGYIYRSYSQKKKANEIITEQKAVVEQKQKEILDSINYAQRIQQAHLPREKTIERNLERLSKKP